MRKQRRTIWFLALLAGTVAGVACEESLPTPAKVGASGGSSSGGTSGKGGTAGSASGGQGSGGATAGAAGSSATGGVAGSGGRTTSTAGAGGGPGGTTKLGSGGAAGAGSGGGSGGADAGRDVGAPERAPADTSSSTRDVSGKNDLRTADSGCPSNQTVCDGVCVDTSASTANCGGCGKACGADQVCSGGACVGTTANDGCTDTVAANLTLQQIAVYQTVKIPVMNNGTEVALSARNASIVDKRQTLIRVFVAPGTGWTAHEVAARLTLVPSGGQPAVYSVKKSISAASTDADQNSTFQFTIAPESMVPPVSYSVAIVECGSASGSAGQARFPATGTADLGVRTTGVMKVKLIPMQVGTIVPDTSEAGTATYLAELAAMYPISAVQFTVGDTLTVASPVDWSGTLTQLRSKRNTDKPANDVYYFGLIKPAETLRDYCKSTCTTGIGYVVTSTSSSAGSSRVAMGIGYADKTSAETMAHELGHNHGLYHAPCSTAGSIADVDSKYPYSNAIIGVWGYDSRTKSLYDPSKYKDIMSYCSNQWISDYNYQPLVTRVANLNGVTNMLSLAPIELSPWLTLILDEKGPRWGYPLTNPVPPEGTPESAIVYDHAGLPLTTVTVYREEIGDISAASYMVPEPKDGWYAIAVGDAVPLPFAAPMPKL